jgi:hypothetical protein
MGLFLPGGVSRFPARNQVATPDASSLPNTVEIPVFRFTPPNPWLVPGTRSGVPKTRWRRFAHRDLTDGPQREGWRIRLKAKIVEEIMIGKAVDKLPGNIDPASAPGSAWNGSAAKGATNPFRYCCSGTTSSAAMEA